jgi:creatinine amidohydrolase
MARFWRDLAWPEFSGLDPASTVAILPDAATEQHGPHLPVGVDDFINAGIVEAAMPLMPESVLVLPACHVGKSNEHLAYPGTLSLGAETLIRVWTELGECVARAGLRKFVMLNSHGGQPQIMDIVARDLRVRLGLFAVAANLSGLHAERGLFDEAEWRHGIHAGASETSQMMFLRRDLVRTGLARNFEPATVGLEREYRFLRAEGTAVGFGWQAQDLHGAGACGDASNADAGRGRAIVESAAAGVAALIAEVARYPLDRLVTGPAREWT